MPAREAKEVLGEDVWKNYFKFCFERNPLDRVISMYHWKNKRNRWKDISEFINKKNLRPLKKKGYYVYTINDEIAVDKIYPYETLEDSLEDVRKMLNIVEDIELFRAKTQYRNKDKKKLKLKSEERGLIKNYFKEEINFLGYEDV